MHIALTFVNLACQNTSVFLYLPTTCTRRLWLSTVKCSIDVQGPQLSVDVSMVSAELWEYLYRNQAMINHITKPVSVSPVCSI